LNTRTAPNGQSTTWTYVTAGPQTVTETVNTSVPNRVTSFTYTPQGKIETVTDPRGKVTSFAYYPVGDLETVTDPLGASTPSPTDHTTTFEYDLLGRRTAVIDPLGHRTETTYNSRGQAVRTRQFDGTRALDTIVEYDQGGRRLTVYDPIQSANTAIKGNRTDYDYDAYGRLWHAYQPKVDGSRPTTTYAYDVMSNLTSLTDAESHTTAFGYDAFNRVQSVTYPGPRTETYTYDTAGRLLTKTDRKGAVTTYGYDGLSRLTSKTYSDTTPPFAYRYDETAAARGFLTSADQGGVHKLAWTYDLVGQTLSEKYYANGTTLTSTVANTYDPGGNRTGLSLDGTTFTTYDYDDASRLSHIYRAATNFAFTYDDAHKRTGLTFPNGVATTYAYDTLSRLTGITAVKTPTVVASAGYTYDDAGNRLTKTLPEYAETYLYDPLYRLREVDRPSPTPTETYTYDKVGNRKTSIDAMNWTYSMRNELTSYGSATFTYDLNGNTLTKNDPTGSWTYEWNAENQLTRVLYSGSVAARFTYDPLGRRVEKVVNNNPPTTYTYDGEDILRENRPTTVASYVHGPGIDEPLAVEALGIVRYLHADALGSDIKHTDPNGAVSLTRTYDAFGQLQTGTTNLAGYAFTGRELDSEIGPLYYYRARYYDPKVGRFMSGDPIGFRGGLNLYAYVTENPALLIDPSGLRPRFHQVCVVNPEPPPNTIQFACKEFPDGPSTPAPTPTPTPSRSPTMYVPIYTGPMTPCIPWPINGKACRSACWAAGGAAGQVPTVACAAATFGSGGLAAFVCLALAIPGGAAGNWGGSECAEQCLP
jgi:RHS repeat-associated protein